MSSLPILSSQTPNNSKSVAGKNNNSTPGAEDISGGRAPFGELLAKQLNPQGRDIKTDILKTITQTELDPSSTDPNALDPSTLGASAIDPTALLGQRTDGLALPSDLLASLLPQDKRVALSDSKDSAADATVETIPGLNEKADEVIPAARLTDGTKTVPINTHDKRADSGIQPDSAFATALQAEKKTGTSAAAGKFDSLTLPLQTTNTSTTIGMPNALATAPVAQTTTAQATITTPLNQAQWADDFSQKVTWMATQRTQSAELHLNPAQLGPLEVSLKLNGDQATLQFTSAHAAVRDAIEQSIPRLRDMLADSGISLGNTTVSDQAPREQQQRDQTGRMQGNGNMDNAPESEAVLVQSSTRLSRHDGVVDTFV
ncbi:MAG: flagellar hook-length control protein FliK [Sideroxydans sp.]|nr:flagellar hook-length control protein FliK [Sideroxydans sp.]